MSNPFHNPWDNNSNRGTSGPIYGNAYEEDSNPINTPSPNFASDGLNNSGYYNAWGQEEVEPQLTANASEPPLNPSPYQFTGTPHGNQSTRPYANSTPSPQPTHLSSPKPPQSKQKNTGRFSRHRLHEEGAVLSRERPNKWALIIRFIIFICSIGHLGFAAGARPYSGEDVPFSTSSCFYYLFAVAILSIIYSGYHLLYSCWRYTANKGDMSRVIVLGLDVLFAVLWGIGIIIEIAKYRCTSGGKFCTFYNVSIFWGFVAFVAYIVSSFGVLIGACRK